MSRGTWIPALFVMAAAISIGGSVLAPAAAAEDAPTGAAPEGEEGVAPSQRVLIVARVDEEILRREFERVAGEELRGEGALVIAGSDVLFAEDLATEEALREKALGLGIDGLLGFVVLSPDDETDPTDRGEGAENAPPDARPFAFLAGDGASLARIGLSSKRVRVHARFYDATMTLAWEDVSSETLRDDNAPVVAKIAKSAARAIVRQDLVGKR